MSRLSLMIYLFFVGEKFPSTRIAQQVPSECQYGLSNIFEITPPLSGMLFEK